MTGQTYNQVESVPEPEPDLEYDLEKEPAISEILSGHHVKDVIKTSGL